MAEDLTVPQGDEKRTDQLIRQVRENVGRLKVQFDELVGLTDELEATVKPRQKGGSP